MTAAWAYGVGGQQREHGRYRCYCGTAYADEVRVEAVECEDRRREGEREGQHTQRGEPETGQVAVGIDRRAVEHYRRILSSATLISHESG